MVLKNEGWAFTLKTVEEVEEVPETAASIAAGVWKDPLIRTFKKSIIKNGESKNIKGLLLGGYTRRKPPCRESLREAQPFGGF
jgi:hypothetical protein